MQQLPINLLDNEIVIFLMLAFALVNILAFRKNGFLIKEIEKLGELRQVRTFDRNESGVKTFSTLLFLQYNLFFGLSLFLVIDQNPAITINEILELNTDSIIKLLLCISAPLIWFLVHLFLFHWFSYISGGSYKMKIIDRIYLAYHILASPIILILFSLSIIMSFPTHIIAILLCAYFIILQFLLIYSIFIIFSHNKGSIYVILLYLCALEIAPFAVIYAKRGM